MAFHDGRKLETYCTYCRKNVSITDAVYVELPTKRVIIRGKCSQCGSEIIKASIMPKSSARIQRRKRKGRRSFPTI